MTTFIEPNDILTNATATGINGIGTAFFTGSIGDNPNLVPGLDIDLFEVQVNAGELLTVDIDAEVIGSELDSYLRLFDASGTELSFNDDDPSNDEFDDSALSFLAMTTGTYYVGVSSDGNEEYDPFVEGSGDEDDTGTYNIAIDVTDFAVEPEPNDTFAQAIETGINGLGSFAVNGAIGDNPNVVPGLDIDLFEVQVNAGEQLTVDIDAEVIGSEIDSYLRLFDASGTELSFNDDDSITVDSLLSFVATTTGTYYVGVSSDGNEEYDPFVEGSGDEDDTGTYRIAINVTDFAVEPEPNDTLAQAIETGINGLGSFAVNGAIGDNVNIAPGLDVDLYQVQLNAGTVLNASVDSFWEDQETGVDAYLRLFDATGNELTTDSELFGFDITADGTYYIGVSAFANSDYTPTVQGSGTEDETGTYSLSVSASLARSALLSTAPGDGGVRVALDAYGSFGSTTGEAFDDPEDYGDDAFYDPLGSQEEAGTIFASALAFRIGDEGARRYLSFEEIDDLSGFAGAAFTAVSATSAQSEFSFSGLEFALDQRVSDILDGDSDRQGSQLIQTYTITNPSATSVDFELIRYVDGDLDFDGSRDDTGGLSTIDGKPVVFETDDGSSATDNTIFIGITDAGGTPLPGFYRIDEYSALSERIESGGSLGNTIVGDTDGDDFIDIEAYDIAIALGRGFTLAPGASVVYTTSTIFGEPSPSEISANIAPVATNDAVTTGFNTPIDIQVLANDSDADGGSLSFVIDTNPSDGSVIVDNNGTPGDLTDDFVTYTPGAGFSGIDTFTYELSDGQGGTTIGTVTVEVDSDIIGVDGDGNITGNAFGAGDPYTGNLFSNTDGTANPDDVIAGTDGDDTIWPGETGNDLIDAGEGNNTIGIGTGDSRVAAGAGDDFIYSIAGGGGTNVIDLGDGNNEAWFEAGDYTLTTGAGDDLIGLGTGTDVVNAGDGNNLIYLVDTIDPATAGDKDILTGLGDDYVETGGGNDLIDAGLGFNTLFGGTGADIFTARTGAYNFIGDFELGIDQIELADFAVDDLSFFQGTGDVAADVFGFVDGEAVLQVANTTVAELDNIANFA
ncbi:MAG: pre-peptidase C-terminal domain-containing protein [Cyanobacteria bacterium J06638_28]